MRKFLAALCLTVLAGGANIARACDPTDERDRSTAAVQLALANLAGKQADHEKRIAALELAAKQRAASGTAVLSAAVLPPCVCGNECDCPPGKCPQLCPTASIAGVPNSFVVADAPVKICDENGCRLVGRGSPATGTVAYAAAPSGCTSCGTGIPANQVTAGSPGGACASGGCGAGATAHKHPFLHAVTHPFAAIRERRGR